MGSQLSRRGFLATGLSAGITAGAVLSGVAVAGGGGREYRVSLSQWSLQRALAGKKLDHLDFARVAAKDLGFEAVEYVSRFFRDKPTSEKYLAEMNKRAAEHNLRQLLIVVVGQGRLGDPDAKKRAQAVARHRPWVQAAKALGCHSICVDAASEGTAEEQLKYVADGIVALSAFAAKQEINVLVQNEVGCSADPEWVLRLLKQVGSKHCGTLPNIGCADQAIRSKVIARLIPVAKGASARITEADAKQAKIDYEQVIQEVLNAGFRGYVGIDYRGKNEMAGIEAAKVLLEKSWPEKKKK